MWQLSRSRHVHCCCCESVNCSMNSFWNCSHTSLMLSVAGSKESTHCPMSHAHLATSLPLIIVSVIETLCIGDLNPARGQMYWWASCKILSELVQSRQRSCERSGKCLARSQVSWCNQGKGLARDRTYWGSLGKWHARMSTYQRPPCKVNAYFPVFPPLNLFNYSLLW